MPAHKPGKCTIQAKIAVRDNGGVLAVILTAVGVFAATNVDDLVVLTFLYMAADGTAGRARVLGGQALGIAVLTAASLVAAESLFAVPGQWVRLLGVIPLGVGLWRLAWALRRGPGPDGERPRGPVTVRSVTTIALLNGVDNVAVYTPLFRRLPNSALAITMVAFLVMVGVWCAAAALLAHHLATVRVIDRWSHLAVPLVFIAIGALLLAGA
jgi:cadmium resistance protein CadD (predicted permease)